MIKICAEKITEENQLTIEEQQHLLDDLLMVEALVVAYEQYCKGIGKFEEARVFVSKFINDLENKDLKDIISETVEKKGGEA